MSDPREPSPTRCPACNGTGDDPDGCGGEGGEDALACIYCDGHGCGGNCPWCGGTGNRRDWRPGNPSYDGFDDGVQG